MTSLNGTTANYESPVTATATTILMKALFWELRALELFLALAVFITIRTLYNSKRQGLPSWPLVGMLPSVLVALKGDIYEWLTGVLHRCEGTFTFQGPWLSNLHCIITADPRNVEHLLKTRFQSFPKGPFFRGIVQDLLGDGIFGADGELWLRQRRPTSLEFHSSKFRLMVVDSLVELVHGRLIPVLEGFCCGKEIFDLQNVLLRLTFDNVSMIAFGVDPGCLQPGLPEIPFAKAFEEATALTIMRFLMPTTMWKALRLLQLGPEKKLRQYLRQVDEFAHCVIRRRKQVPPADEAERKGNSDSTPSWNRMGSDLLTQFMSGRDDDGNAFSDAFLRDVCVNFILAGRDTSSVALAWFFWLLGQHPEVEEKVLQELCGVLALREQGKEWVPSLTTETVFRPEEVKKMEYLQATLSEALRLYPSVPVDQKEADEDEVFPDGTQLKKGTKVIYAIYSMGRMESIWGTDCREFKPERWLHHDGRFMSESAYKFTAFNGGPRQCLGKDFAYYQMKFVAASILYRYRVRIVRSHPVVPKLGLTMYMKHGLMVKLEKWGKAELAKFEMGDDGNRHA